MATDEELDRDWDRDWKPNRRPQSTMAQSFSLALNDLFKIDNSLADLDAAVSEKKRAVSSQTSELEALEARLRATEERLKRATNSAMIHSNQPRNGRSSPRQRLPLGETLGPDAKDEYHTSPPATEFMSNISRPNTGRPQTKDGRSESGWKGEAPMPGALPPTPGASEGESDSEYVVVDGQRHSTDIVEDGDHPTQI